MTKLIQSDILLSKFAFGLLYRWHEYLFVTNGAKLGNETKQTKLNDPVYVTKRVLDTNKTSVTRVTPAQHDCCPSDMSARRVWHERRDSGTSKTFWFW